MRKYSDFRKARKLLEIVAPNVPVDLCFFGSDTLWNFEDTYFVKKTAFFTGAKIEKPCYSYSVAVGSTPKEVFFNHSEAIRNISKFKGLAVRDEYTEELVSAIYPHKKIIRTVDPTMLIDKEIYTKYFAAGTINTKRTLVVYYFGNIPQKTWEALCCFARERKLEIINVGSYGDRIATTVVASPSNFISVFAEAEYIFTNTFHGCVFSAVFNKQFATDGIGKKKVACFLDEFSLCDRVAGEEKDVATVLSTPVNYDRVNELIKEGRERSIAYLNRCIREVEEHE